MTGHGRNNVSSHFPEHVGGWDQELFAMAAMPEPIRHYLMVEINIDVSAVSVYNAYIAGRDNWPRAVTWDDILTDLKIMSRMAQLDAFGNTIPERIYHGRYDKVGRLKGENRPRRAVRREIGRARQRLVKVGVR